MHYAHTTQDEQAERNRQARERVVRLRKDGLSIAVIAIRLRISERKVLKLLAEVRADAA